MPEDSTSSREQKAASASRAAGSDKYQLPTDPAALIRLGIIGVLLLIIVGSFAYVAGWLSPNLLTPRRFTDGFEQVNGIHEGFRRNHAKGVCVAGNFQANGEGTRLSKAVVFKAGSVPVIGRFSMSGGNPYAHDGPFDVRALALAFRPAAGQEWRTAMVDVPVLPVRTPQGFYDQMFAMQPDPSTGRPSPDKVKAFLAAHPEAVAARSIIGAYKFATGFANTTYNSINAFRFENEAGDSSFVRWSMVPVDAFVLRDSLQPADKNPNYQFDALIQRIQQGPVQWHLMLTVAQPGDAVEDASIPLPPDRQRVDAGTLTIDHIESEAPGNCRDINFDPLVLPAGISPSNDPVLSARSAVYSQSFTRREGEKKSPSMVQVPGSGKGE